MSRVFCIIPAFNESSTIVEVLNKVKPFVDTVVVVDDCSADNTVDLARANGAMVLKHVVNRGQGAALRTGTEFALVQGADIIVHFDADGQFVATDIKKAIEPILSDRAEIVFGSRFLELSGAEHMPWMKRNVIMPLAKFVNRLFFGINMTDPQSGFRAFDRVAAERIKWSQDRMAHCSEILYNASRSGLRIVEVPITVIYHDFGQKFSGGVKIIKELLLGALLK